MKKYFKKLKKTYILYIGGVIIAFALSFGVYGMYQYTQLSNTLAQLSQDPERIEKLTKDEEKKLITKVNTLVALPTGEEPTIAIVTDKEKLENRQMFAQVDNGDRLLFYTKGGIIIAYRPSLQKVIDIIHIAQPGTSQAAVTAQPPPASGKIRVILYNGTTTVGITKKVETQLTSQSQNIEIVDKDFAKHRDYKKSIIIDISNNFSDQLDVLSKLFSIASGPLPKGEASPSSDILIIVGEDMIK